MTLVLIGLVGGIITGLSPCVLPVLPVVFLGGGAGPGGERPGGAGPDANPGARSARRRPYLIVLGLTLSFAVFTLFGTLILASLHLPDDAIRWIGLALLVLVGLGLLVPPPKNTTGNTGSTHGDKPVMIPPTRPIKTSVTPQPPADDQARAVLRYYVP